MEEWKARWPNFAPEEILSPIQLELFQKKGVLAYSAKALDKLEEFRSFLGVPLQINKAGTLRRGARSTWEVYQINRQTRGNERGWEYSFHLWCAFDVSSLEMSVEELHQKALEFGKWGGIGHYDTFIHVDDRDSLTGLVAQWDYRKDKA